MTHQPPLTDQELNAYAVLATTAGIVGDKVDPAVVTRLVAESAGFRRSAAT